MKRIVLMVAGLLFIPSLASAALPPPEKAVEAVVAAVEAEAECVDMTIRNARTGAAEYFSSCSEVGDLAGDLRDAANSEGVVYYSDGQSHTVARILSSSVRQGSAGIDANRYRLVLTRVINPGDGRSTGLLPKPSPPPCPVRPEDLRDLTTEIGQ